MKKMTEQNLTEAFAGESQAHMKYISFAERAGRDGWSNIARLFRAASYAEQCHAGAHLRQLKGIGSTAENLETAIGGETFEFESMYPAYEAVAITEGEKGALTSIQRAMDAEKVHAALYTRARESVGGNKDVELGQMVVCPVCGWTHEGDSPDACPLCGTKKERFVTF